MENTRELGLPLQWEPEDLVPLCEAVFGSVFFYRVVGGGARKRTLYVCASLDDAYLIYPRRIVRRGKIVGENELVKFLRHVPRSGCPARRPFGFRKLTVFGFAYDFTPCRAALADHERLPEIPEPAADALLGFVSRPRDFVVYDPARRRLTVSARSKAKLASLCDGLETLPTNEKLDQSQSATGKSRIGLIKWIKPRFRRQMESIRGHLANGRVYQLVLATKLSVKTQVAPARLVKLLSGPYRNAPYAFYFNVAGHAWVGSCRLPHITKVGNQISTVVLAGTDRAPRNPQDVLRIKQRLRHPRYYSEHIMLVDLERNDLGKFCRPGSVRVSRLLSPVVVGATTYLSSRVSGKLPERPRMQEILFSNFPRGVVTGAPKAESQKIISSVENSRRGFYSGMIGFYDEERGDIVSNTIVTCAGFNNGRALIPCAGGITVRSRVDREVKELSYKFKIMLSKLARG